jgi:hypothetical protein
MSDVEAKGSDIGGLSHAQSGVGEHQAIWHDLSKLCALH